MLGLTQYHEGILWLSATWETKILQFPLTVRIGSSGCVCIVVIQVLESLVDIGEIEPEKAEYGKEKYLEVHTALIRSMQDEAHLLEQAKTLHQMLEVSCICFFQPMICKYAD